MEGRLSSLGPFWSICCVLGGVEQLEDGGSKVILSLTPMLRGVRHFYKIKFCHRDGSLTAHNRF